MFFDSVVVLKDAIQNENITIEKCRKLAMIIGAPPEVFFKIKKRKAIPIESKAELVERFLDTPCNSTIANYLPVVLQNMLGVGKNMGGKKTTSPSPARPSTGPSTSGKGPDKTGAGPSTRPSTGPSTSGKGPDKTGAGPSTRPSTSGARPSTGPTDSTFNNTSPSWSEFFNNKYDDISNWFSTKSTSKPQKEGPCNECSNKITIGIAIALLFFIFKKGLKQYRLYNMVAKDEKMIRDKVFAIKLKNEGVYNGCLKESDLIHQIFKKSFLKNESIEKLRYRLLTEWETSYFSQYYLQSIHLIRENGKMRSTAEEIGNAILYHTSIFGLPSKGINYLFSRRKSSRSYNQSKKKRRSNSKKLVPKPKRKSSSKKQLPSPKSSYFKSSRSMSQKQSRSMSQKQSPQRKRSSYLKHSR